MQDCYLNLSHMDLKGNYYNGLKFFIKINRRQCVHLHGSRSDWTNIFSGVPQGGILGPFLLIFYVNDMPNAWSF